VALTTLTSELGSWNRPPSYTRAAPLPWFGRAVPDKITNISVMRDHINDVLLVRWRIKGDPDIHEMPFAQTDEGVMAALAAMKLTC
jgi:hypothetical protein